MQNVTLSNLKKDLESFNLCSGVQTCERSGKLFHNVVPLDNHYCYDSSEDEEQQKQQQLPHQGYWRKKGFLLLRKEDICSVRKTHDEFQRT